MWLFRKLYPSCLNNQLFWKVTFFWLKKYWRRKKEFIVQKLNAVEMPKISPTFWLDVISNFGIQPIFNSFLNIPTLYGSELRCFFFSTKQKNMIKLINLFVTAKRNDNIIVSYETTGNRQQTCHKITPIFNCKECPNYAGTVWHTILSIIRFSCSKQKRTKINNQQFIFNILCFLFIHRLRQQFFFMFFYIINWKFRTDKTKSGAEPRRKSGHKET